jgi:hypothetical protein
MIIIIPGWFISLVTFPGVVIHEIAHRLFCDLTNTPVYHVTYFTIFDGERAGCVVHLRPTRVRHSFLIALAPLIINSLVCMILTIHTGTNLLMSWTSCCYNPPHMVITKFLIFWVGISAGLHAIPSNTDLDSIKQSERRSVRYFVHCITSSLRLFNISYIGLLFKMLYTALLSSIIPFFLMICQ